MLTLPSIMLRALKVCRDGGAEPEDCLNRVLRDLRQAKEPNPQDMEGLRTSIRGAFETLEGAGLLDRDGEAGFVLTERGARVLRDHPLGVDASVLEAFPDYRAFLRQQGGIADGATVEEPKPQFAEGYAAFHSGADLADNPYPFDSAAHLEWENGWGEARKRDGAGPRNQERDR